MDDRALLTKAAKAAGLQLGELDGRVVRIESDGQPVYWNSLESDSDALRLAVKLGMSLDTWLGQSLAIVLQHKDCLELHNGDPYAATRRAITRAAAALEGE